MSSLLSWMSQCKDKIKKNRETLQKLRKRDEKDSSGYVVPAGWVSILSAGECPGYYFGLHHKYMGLRLDSRRDKEIFACRDIILSWLLSASRTPANASSDLIAAAAIIDLFCDIGKWKSTEKVEGHLYQTLRVGIDYVRTFYSTIAIEDLSPVIAKQNDTIKNYFNPPDSFALLWNQFRDKKVELDHNHNSIDILILAMSIYELEFSKFDLESALFSLLVSLVKNGSASNDYIEKRFTSFSHLIPSTGFYFLEVSSETITELWKIISYHLQSGTSSIDIILENLNKVMAAIDNVVLKPMPSFLAYRGMTPIVNILNSISNFPSFPWNSLIKSNSQIKAEFITLKKILQVCRDDVLLGYKISGAGTAVPNLSYLSICLLIDVGGNETLKNYRGIGPHNKSKVTGSTYLNSLVEGYKKSILSGTTGYDQLHKMEDKMKNLLEKSGLNTLMAAFLSGVTESTEQESQRDRDFDDSSSDSDSDPDNDSPRPSGSKKTSQETTTSKNRFTSFPIWRSSIR